MTRIFTMTLLPAFPTNVARCILAGLLLISGTAPASTQQPQTAADVEKIVREASWNEMHSSGPPHYVRYRVSEQNPTSSTVKLVIQTKDGTVVRLIEKGGQPLSAADNDAEVARLKNLLAHPEIQQRRHKSESQSNNREDEMVRMLPDAFLYTSEGMVKGPNGDCYRLSFRPNPSFVPPDREGEVFHGMMGEAWIDEAQLRIVKIDAHLISDVNFGWGVLGRLYRGGSMFEMNEDVGGPNAHHWESTELKLRLTGKILMVKSVDYSTTENYTDFHSVSSDTTYQQAIQILLSYPTQ
jgi:hypothetical protein